MAVDLSKQEELDTDPKAIQHFNFIGNLEEDQGGTMVFVTEYVKETILDFSQGTVKVLWVYFSFI